MTYFLMVISGYVLSCSLFSSFRSGVVFLLLLWLVFRGFSAFCWCVVLYGILQTG